MKQYSFIGAAVLAAMVLLTPSLVRAQDEPSFQITPPGEADAADDFLVEGFEQPPDDLDPRGEVGIDYFIDKLSPYGSWFWTEAYGWVWQPDGLADDWKPFTYGHWEYSDYGWTWVSHFPWGWAAFHYGAWTHLDSVGWVWVPAGIWSPARVIWRYSEVYVGWAPILAGYDYWVGWYEYPIYYTHWIFITWHFFGHHHPYLHFVHHHHVNWCYHHTHYPKSCGHSAGPACHHGPSPKKVSKLTGQPIKRGKIKLNSRAANRGPGAKHDAGEQARRPSARKPGESGPAARTPRARPSKPVTIGRQLEAPRSQGPAASRSNKPNRRSGSAARQPSPKPSVESGSRHQSRSQPAAQPQRPSRSQPSHPQTSRPSRGSRPSAPPPSRTSSSRPSSNSKVRSSGSKDRGSAKSSKSSSSSTGRSKSSGSSSRSKRNR